MRQRVASPTSVPAGDAAGGVATTVAVTAVRRVGDLQRRADGSLGLARSRAVRPACMMAPLARPLKVPLMEEPVTIVYLVPTVWSQSAKIPRLGRAQLDGATGARAAGS